MNPKFRSCRTCEHRRGFAFPECQRFQTNCMYAVDRCGYELTQWVARRPWWWRIVRSILGIGGFVP